MQLLLGCFESCGTPFVVSVDRRMRFTRFALTDAQQRSLDDTSALKSALAKKWSSWSPARAHTFDLFEGTLLDCERMGDGVYVLLDMVSLGGYNVRRETFDKRIEMGCLVARRVSCVVDVASKIWHDMGVHPGTQKAAHRNDGVILMPRSTSVQTGRHPSMYKLKTEHTIDLLLREGQWSVVCDGALQRVHVDVAAGTTDDDGVYELLIENVDKEEEEEEGALQSVRAHVLHKRPDKESPNDMETVMHTIQNVEEGIVVDDLFIKPPQ